MGTEIDGVNGIIKNTTSDGDITIKGNDGGSEITALTLDMSVGGQLLASPLGVSIPSYSFSGDANTGMTRPTSDALQFVTAGSEAVRIDSSQRVGINTSSPSSNLHIGGTTPTLTIGDAGAEDTKIVFDGNAQDFYVALDDSEDDLVIGLGSTVGTTPIMSFDESKNVTIHDGTLTVESDNANALMAPLLQLDRISSSPADGDLIGAIRYTGRLDNGNSAEFAGLEAKIIESSTADGEITLNIAKGGNVRSALKANNTEVIINDASEDIDFRVESNGNTHQLFVDGGNDRIYVGGGSGSSIGSNKFQVQNGGATISSFANDSGSNQLHFIKSRNTTVGSQTIVNDGDSVGGIFWKADDGDATDYNNNVAGIEGVIDGTPGTNDTPGRLVFYTTNDGERTNTERMRIRNNGRVNIGDVTNSHDGIFTTTQETAGDGYSVFARHSASSGTVRCIRGHFTAQAPDDSTSVFITMGDNSTTRFNVNADGDVTNHDNAYGQISDERIKTNITDANSQWADIKAIKVKNFERKDDVTQYGEGKKVQIGVVAQEVETVSPGLIKEGEPTIDDIKMSSAFGTLYEDGDTIPEDKKIGDIKSLTGEKVKKVSYSVLYMKAIKALQEAQTRIETLETKVAALEG